MTDNFPVARGVTAPPSYAPPAVLPPQPTRVQNLPVNVPHGLGPLTQFGGGLNRHGQPREEPFEHEKSREERLAKQRVEKKAAQAERVAAKEAAKKAAEEAANQRSWLEIAANVASEIRKAVQGAINQASSYFVEAPVEAPKTEIELATPQPIAVSQAANKKERTRKDVPLLLAQVNGNIISVNAQMPENVNLTAIAENSGLTDPNFAVNFQVNATANGIVGESTLIIPSGVAQVVLSVNGVPLSGAAYQSAASNNTFSLLSPAINLVLNTDSVTLFGSGALNGGSIAIEDLSPDPAAPNSVANVLGIFPATPAFVTNAPYVHSAAAQPDGVGYDGNMQLYKASSGNFYTVAKVTGADDLPQLVQQFYTASGVHLAAQDNVLFSIANTGPVGSTDTAIPTNNTESISAGTFTITDFSTRPLPDGNVEVAVVYDIGTAETAGVVMAVSQDGKIIAGFREINAGIRSSAFSRVRRTIAVNGVVPEGNNVFAAFSKGGVPQDGYLVNATDLSITSSPLADHPALETPANSQVVVGFNEISANGNVITAATFSNPNGIRTDIENIRAYSIANNETYVANSFSGDQAIAGHSTIIIVPPSVQGANIVFAANASYTMVNQGGNAKLFFPQPINAQSVVTEMVDVDGVASVKAIFPGNTNITFYGENQEFVINLTSQLQVVTTEVPASVASTSVTQPDTSAAATLQPTSQSSSISNSVSDTTSSLSSASSPTADSSTFSTSKSDSQSDPATVASTLATQPDTSTAATLRPTSQSSSISQSSPDSYDTATATYSVTTYTRSASTVVATAPTASTASNTPTTKAQSDPITTEDPISSTSKSPPNNDGGNAEASVLVPTITVSLAAALVAAGVVIKHLRNRRDRNRVFPETVYRVETADVELGPMGGPLEAAPQTDMMQRDRDGQVVVAESRVDDLPAGAAMARSSSSGSVVDRLSNSLDSRARFQAALDGFNNDGKNYDPNIDGPRSPAPGWSTSSPTLSDIEEAPLPQSLKDPAGLPLNQTDRTTPERK